MHFRFGKIDALRCRRDRRSISFPEELYSHVKGTVLFRRYAFLNDVLFLDVVQLALE